MTSVRVPGPLKEGMFVVHSGTVSHGTRRTWVCVLCTDTRDEATGAQQTVGPLWADSPQGLGGSSALARGCPGAWAGGRTEHCPDP